MLHYNFCFYNSCLNASELTRGVERATIDNVGEILEKEINFRLLNGKYCRVRHFETDRNTIDSSVSSISRIEMIRIESYFWGT